MADGRLRKLFLSALDHEVTEQDLKTYFETYGPVTECIVLKERATARSRGKAFVTFQSPETVDDVQAQRPHHIHGSEMETRRAIPEQHFDKLFGCLSVKKIFVGNLGDNIDASHLRKYFSQYGNVRCINVIVDRESQRRRGFAFVEFDDYDPVDKIVLQGRHEINGRPLDVKKGLNRREILLFNHSQGNREILMDTRRNRRSPTDQINPAWPLSEF